MQREYEYKDYTGMVCQSAGQRKYFCQSFVTFVAGHSKTAEGGLVAPHLVPAFRDLQFVAKELLAGVALHVANIESMFQS